MKKTFYSILLGTLAMVGFARAAASYPQEMVDAFDWAYTQGLTSTGDINQVNLYSGMNKGEAIQVLNVFVKNLHLPAITISNWNSAPSDVASGGFFISYLVKSIWPGNYPNETDTYTIALQKGLISTTGGLQGQQIRGNAFILLHRLYENIPNIHTTPTTQSAISGSLVTFTVTRTNGTGDVYLKYILPQTSSYNVSYANASIVPMNNALLALGIEHDPVFAIAANSTFSVTITAKMLVAQWIFPTTLDTTAVFATGLQFSPILTSEVSQITPIADLRITNVLTGTNPSISGDNVSYYITLQNIGSAIATGISFISTFPIPTLSAPTATFNTIPYAYTFINYPQDFVWSGNYLANVIPGQTVTILLNGVLTQSFPIGTSFSQIAKATTMSPEYTTGNNSVTATGVVQSAADVWINKTLAPFTGYAIGDKVIYTITYGNSGGKVATNVNITDIVPANITLPVNTFTLGSLPVGSGGSIILTGTLSSTFVSGQVFVNTANISTSSMELNTGNNSASATGVVQGISAITVDIIANNISKPQYDNVPYGSGPNVLIQAISGDIVKLTITYANLGNATGTNASIGISGTQGFVSLGNYNGNIGTLPSNQTGTIIITGIVGPKNYISFAPTARLSYNGNQLITDSVTIQEPMVCGDGILTRNESCDTLGNIGVLFSGQICENQQGMCVLRTESIINKACINYQYTNQLGIVTTGQACSDVSIPLSSASCTSMTGSTPTSNGNGYNVNLSCRGTNTTPTTPIIIDCGNGTSIAGTGSNFNGVCSYAPSFVGNAQCKVGNDMNNSACRVPISLSAGQCKSLDALDGTISLVDDNNNASSRFKCETVNNTVAQKLTIDCGDGNNYHTEYNVSSLESVCEYHNVDVPQNYTVRCLVDDIETPVCRQTIIIDDAGLGYCGDGFRQGYEDCDDGDLNGTSHSSCSKGCDLGGSLMACFNVGNTSISIQKGEKLPFRWTLDFKDNIIPGNSCDGKRAGSVPEDSIYCTFDIYNGENTEADGDPVYSVRKRCNEDNRGNSTLFKYFLDQGWRSLTNSFGRYYLDSNDFVDNIFGEYKISLDKVEYKYCRDDEKAEGTQIDRVCSVDFSVTQPYLTQKSSFGLTPKSTSIPLEGYKMINGDELIDSTDLEDIMILKESDYAGGGDVATMMNAFINKYAKLAVKNGTLTSDEGNTITVYKVPGQDILVFKGNGTITYTDTNKTKPFTVILDGPSIKINGSIEKTNSMFLLNKGDIIFSSADACAKTQVVKGIFVTNEGSFRAGADITNTDLNRPWCNFGGLKVQGILIGNGIEDLVSSRRSQLNGWFFVGGTSPAAIRAERRNEIFNGASVLIEYSPNLWNALPPGASEFTKALDIYKQ